MNHEVERYEGELRELRAEVKVLRARLDSCTCGGAAEDAPAELPNEQQLDLVNRLTCMDCD